MKRISTLALVAAVGLFQTGCFNNAADSNPPQEAQAASIAAPATAQPVATPVASASVAAPAAAPAAAPVQAAAPVAAAPVAAAPVAAAPVAPAPVSPAPVAAAPAAPQVNANTYFVSTNDGTALNVRASTSTQAQVIGSLPQGSQVLMHLSDRSGEWFEVSAAGGVRGWVAAAYLIDPNGYRAASSVPAQVTPAPVPTSQTSQAYYEYGDYYDLQVQTMDGDPLNLRSGPTREAGVIRSVPNGGSLIYLDEVGRWTQVQTPDGVVGFVASDYLIYR